MKSFIVLLLLLALAVFFLAADSFRSQFFGAGYSPFSIPEAPAAPVAKELEGGGAPRKNPTSTVNSSNPNGFVGPSGPPHIVGPSGPPPGQ